MDDALAAVWAFAQRSSWSFGDGREEPPDAPRTPLSLAHRSRDHSATTSPSATQSSLLTRLRDGDQRALAEAYDALYEPLWRLAVILVRDGDVAEEIVHDVFLTMWEQRESLNIRGDMRVYLSAAIRNRVRNLRKHHRVVSAVESAVTAQALSPPGLARPAQPPDAAAEADEFFQAYRRILAALTERDRVALRLRWEDDLTFEQIGQILELSTVGARALVLRAQEKVRAALTGHRPT